MKIDIFEHEAEVIAKYLLDMNEKKLIYGIFFGLRTMKDFPTDSYEWRHIPMGQRACPFLQDHNCIIYKVRPSACRLYFVSHTTNPSDCILDERTRQVPVPRFKTLELMLSAIGAIEKKLPMGQALLKMED
jgi:Fe-S-cluster containining protein